MSAARTMARRIESPTQFQCEWNWFGVKRHERPGAQDALQPLKAGWTLIARGRSRLHAGFESRGNQGKHASATAEIRAECSFRKGRQFAFDSERRRRWVSVDKTKYGTRPGRREFRNCIASNLRWLEGSAKPRRTVSAKRRDSDCSAKRIVLSGRIFGELSCNRFSRISSWRIRAPRSRAFRAFR